MLKMSAFSFDACGKTFAKTQNRFSNWADRDYE